MDSTESRHSECISGQKDVVVFKLILSAVVDPGFLIVPENKT